MALILASASPRRRELLSLITKDFTVETSQVDEAAITAPTPAKLAQALADAKCRAVAAQHPEDIVIGCDTVVDYAGRVFGKPKDHEDALRMLRALSGAQHHVHTGVCIAYPGGEERFTVTPWRKPSWRPMRPPANPMTRRAPMPFRAERRPSVRGWKAVITM